MRVGKQNGAKQEEHLSQMLLAATRVSHIPWHSHTRENAARNDGDAPSQGPLQLIAPSTVTSTALSHSQGAERATPVPQAISGGGAWAVMGSQTPPLLPPLPPLQAQINAYNSPAEIINPSLPCLYAAFCTATVEPGKGVTALGLGGS